MKGQVLADFIAKFTPKNDGKIICNVENRPWKVFVDDALNAMVGAEVGIVIITSEGIRLEHSFRLGFKASNNEAEGCGDLFRFSTGCLSNPGKL